MFKYLLSKRHFKSPFGNNMTTEGAVEVIAGEIENMSISGPVKFVFHFPEEVWILILNELKEDADRINCCLAFPYLDTILTKTKPVWQFKQILPLIEDRLLFNELLNCRGTCVRWCEDIDNILQDYQRGGHSEQLIQRRYSFLFLEQMNSFMETFDDSIGNPIVGRGIMIRIIAGPVPAFKERAFELLSKFGKHVWTLHLSDLELGRGVPAMHFYRFVQVALTYTPNLKYLALDGYDGFAFLALTDIDGYMMEIGGRMSHNLLPFLPHLETMTLSLVNYSQVMRNMIMLPYINQLNYLTIRMANWNPSFASGLASLTSLELRGIGSVDQLEMLINTPFSGPLDRLKLNISTGGISVVVLLRLIRHLPLLDSVFLELGDGCGLEDGEEDSDLGQLVNSTVKLIRIQHDIPISYNFFKVLKALQYLEIMLKVPFDGDKLMEEDTKEWVLKAISLLESGGVNQLLQALPNLGEAEIYKVGEGKEKFMFKLYVAAGESRDH